MLCEVTTIMSGWAVIEKRKTDYWLMTVVSLLNIIPADEQVLSDGTHGGVSVPESWRWRKLAETDGISSETHLAAAGL